MSRHHKKSIHNIFSNFDTVRTYIQKLSSPPVVLKTMMSPPSKPMKINGYDGDAVMEAHQFRADL